MATKPVTSIIAAKAALDAINALIGSSSTLKIYSGTQPATTLTARSGTLGCTLLPSSTPFPASTSGTGNGLATATANAIAADTNAANSITAGYFSWATSGAVVIYQGNVGTSSADMIMNTTTITAGDTVACTSFLVTLPCGDGVT